MTSTAQINTNRANAQFSTGPKSDQGKANSSKNARSHGLTAREFVIAPAEQEVFVSFEADHRNDLKPEGAIEETLFAQILHSAWNLRRVRLLEAELANSLGFDPLTDDQTKPNWIVIPVTPSVSSAPFIARSKNCAPFRMPAW